MQLFKRQIHTSIRARSRMQSALFNHQLCNKNGTSTNWQQTTTYLVHEDRIGIRHYRGDAYSKDNQGRSPSGRGRGRGRGGGRGRGRGRGAGAGPVARRGRGRDNNYNYKNNKSGIYNRYADQDGAPFSPNSREEFESEFEEFLEAQEARSEIDKEWKSVDFVGRKEQPDSLKESPLVGVAAHEGGEEAGKKGKTGQKHDLSKSFKQCIWDETQVRLGRKFRLVKRNKKNFEETTLAITQLENTLKNLLSIEEHIPPYSEMNEELFVVKVQVEKTSSAEEEKDVVKASSSGEGQPSSEEQKSSSISTSSGEEEKSSSTDDSNGQALETVSIALHPGRFKSFEEEIEVVYNQLESLKEDRTRYEDHMKTYQEYIDRLQMARKELKGIPDEDIWMLKDFSDRIQKDLEIVIGDRFRDADEQSRDPMSFVYFKGPDGSRIYLARTIEEKEALAYDFAGPRDIWLRVPGAIKQESLHALVKPPLAGKQTFPSNESVNLAAKAITSNSTFVKETTKIVKDKVAVDVAFGGDIYRLPKRPENGDIVLKSVSGTIWVDVKRDQLKSFDEIV